MSTFENNIIPIKKLHISISKWVDEETTLKYFNAICDEFDNKWKIDLQKNHWRNSKVRKLLQVHERIQITDKLNEDIGEEFIKRYLYPQMITYLRLTCFDQLGQPSEWMTFDNWLKSKKNRQAKEQIISEVQHLEKLEFAEALYLRYQELYGVKNSFFNFIRNILPEIERVNLLSHIKIRIHDESLPALERREGLEKDKEDYLYMIRNDYTHNTFSSSPIKDFKEKEWHFMETIYKGKESHWISIHSNFQEKLKEAVLIGIAEIIKTNKHSLQQRT